MTAGVVNMSPTCYLESLLAMIGEFGCCNVVRRSRQTQHIASFSRQALGAMFGRRCGGPDGRGSLQQPVAQNASLYTHMQYTCMIVYDAYNTEATYAATYCGTRWLRVKENPPPIMLVGLRKATIGRWMVSVGFKRGPRTSCNRFSLR